MQDSINIKIKRKVENVIIKSDTSIRDFSYFVFNYFYGNNWKEIIDECIIKPAKINDINFQSYDLDVFKRLFASFIGEQNKDSLTSSSSQRYFEKPIFVLDSRYFYFTTQH